MFHAPWNVQGGALIYSAVKSPGAPVPSGILFRFRSEGLTARSRLADNPNTAVKIQNARFPTPR